MGIERHGSGGPWEPVVGYSRVVAGPIVEVAGCTAIDAEGNIVGGLSVYEQARQALANVVAALATVGARPEDVMRTRMFITDISRWKEVGRAHGEVFGERPAGDGDVRDHRAARPADARRDRGHGIST